MYLSIPEFPFFFQLFLAALLLLQLLLAVKSIDWASLYLLRVRQHLVFGSLFILFILWQLRGWFDDQIAIYVLGVNLLTLILGWAYATVIVVINHVLLVLIGTNQQEFFLVNTFFFAALPVVVSFLCYRLVVYFFDNPFAYIFLCGFWAAVATLVVPAAVLWVVMSLVGMPKADLLWMYLTYSPVICIPEGVLNGMILVSLVIFHPDLVKTYDEFRYEENSRNKYQ
jgi:uncharacterized membrane protein